MAITRTTFTGSYREDQWEQVSTWMSENASDLFTLVIDSENHKIFCNKLDENNARMTVYPKNDSWPVTLCIPTTSSSIITTPLYASSSIVFTYAVRTNNGIYLNWNFGPYPSGVFISKTNTDDLFCLYFYFNGYTSDGHTGWANLTQNTGNSNAPMVWDGISYNFMLGGGMSMQAGNTSLVPLVIEESDEYCPYLFQIAFNQYKGLVGKLTLNGKEYFSNGYFALAD